MSSKRSKSKKPEKARLDGHAHAVYGPWAYRLAYDVLEEEFGESVRVRVAAVKARRVPRRFAAAAHSLTLFCATHHPSRRRPQRIAEALVALGPSSQPELRTYLASKRVLSTMTGHVLSSNRVRRALASPGV